MEDTLVYGRRCDSCKNVPTGQDCGKTYGGFYAAAPPVLSISEGRFQDKDSYRTCQLESLGREWESTSRGRTPPLLERTSVYFDVH